MKLFRGKTDKVVEKVSDTVENVVKATSKQAQSTQRQENDMKSDSWLSKNIRPIIALQVINGYLFALGYKAYTDGLTDIIMSDIKDLAMGVFMFYFASRGIEKLLKRR